MGVLNALNIFYFSYFPIDKIGNIVYSDIEKFEPPLAKGAA